MELNSSASIAGDDEKKIYESGELVIFARMLSPQYSLQAQAVAVDYFRRLLIKKRRPPRIITDELIQGLIRCLSYDDTKIQIDAAWTLTNCACAPHHICEKIIRFGGIAALVNCARTTDGEARDQAFWTLGNIAADCVNCRNEVRRSSVLPLMISILNEGGFMESKFKKNLVWSMCQVLRGGNGQLGPFHTWLALRGLYQLLFIDDLSLKCDAIWCIAHLADQPADAEVSMILRVEGLLNRLVDSLTDTTTMAASLRALGNLVAGNDLQTQAVLNAGILPRLALLYNDVKTTEKLKRQIAWILSNVAAGTSAQIDQLFDCSGIDRIIFDASFSPNRSISIEASWAVVNALTGANVSRTCWLCSADMLRAMTRILSADMSGRIRERALVALQGIIEKRPNYLIAFRSLGITALLQNIVNESAVADPSLQGLAATLLQADNELNTSKLPPTLYCFKFK